MTLKKLGIAVFAVVLSFSVQAAEISLQWDPSPDTNAIGYKIYYTTGTNRLVKDVAGSTSSFIAVDNGNNYSIYVTAYDSAKIESDPSNTVSYSVPDTFPNTPIVLSSSVVQTNGTLRIKIDWQPAPYEENVTGYKLDVLTNGVLLTNFFGTNLSASFTVNQKLTTTAWLSKSNFYGLSPSSFAGRFKQPAAPNVHFVRQTK
jgi:fibronectin type 3 domain-containing protein